MTVTLRARTGGDFRAATGGFGRDVALAVKGAFAAAGQGLKIDLRQQAARSLGSRLPSALDVRVYPARAESLNPGIAVFGRGAKADAILHAHEAGAAIAAQGGRYLAIPLDPRQRLPGRQGRITPAAYEATYRVQLVPVRIGGRIYLFDPKIRRRKGEGRAQRAVFVLVPRVRLPRRLGAAAALARWSARIPGFIDRLLPRG